MTHQAEQDIGDVLHEVNMEQVVEKDNMRLAFKKVKAKKGAPGVDGISTEHLEAHLRVHWPSIREKLLTGSYQPGPIKGTNIGNGRSPVTPTQSG